MRPIPEGVRRDGAAEADRTSTAGPRLPGTRGQGQRVRALGTGDRRGVGPPFSFDGPSAPDGAREQGLHQTPWGSDAGARGHGQVPRAAGRWCGPAPCRKGISGSAHAGRTARGRIRRGSTQPLRDVRGCFLLRVRGDSMAGAGILPGVLVIVRPQTHAAVRDIVAALVGEDATVKRLAVTGETPVLLPENPAYQPIRDAFQVIGRVMGVLRQYQEVRTWM